MLIVSHFYGYLDQVTIKGRCGSAAVIVGSMNSKMELFLITLFTMVPGLLAMSDGAPSGACGDLMPQHGAPNQPTNNGYFILSDAVNGYTPGQQYLGNLVSTTCHC